MTLTAPVIDFDPSVLTDDVFVVTVEGWIFLADYGGYIFIPKGHTTDLSTVPWVFRWALSKLALGKRGPMVHDLLYRERGHAIMRFDSDLERNVDVVMTRSEADEILRKLALLDQRRAWKCWAAWVAVRCGGWVHW